jgi:uncharacterized protein YndB with AHSA1/START domain
VSNAGNLVEIDGRAALRFERRYAHPMERVWRAITDPEEMRAWFPSNVDGERAVGAPLTFVDDDQRQAAIDAGEPTRVEGPMFRGEVIAYDPPRLFSFTWGSELLRLELSELDDGTRLVFTQILSHQSVAARNGAGWHQCLGGLDALLGQAGPDDDWRAVYADYVERIGPELGRLVGDGVVEWERATHVDPEQVRATVTDPDQVAAWDGVVDDGVHWAVEPQEVGAVYRLRVDHIGDDAKQAATWHARLVQLDMYLAAGQLIPVDPATWVAAYEELLSHG